MPVKKKPFSATKYTLAHLRKLGWTCAIVERWNPHARIRQDLFGFADLLCCKDRILAVQCTTAANCSKRRRKILAEPRAAAWVKAGGMIWLMGWKKVKNKWAVHVLETIEAEHFAEDEHGNG